MAVRCRAASSVSMPPLLSANLSSTWRRLNSILCRLKTSWSLCMVARMVHEPIRAENDVLVLGSGGAGMYAAIEAARAGCRVLLPDRSLVGRGGATVMAQMTVAVALGSATADHWGYHYQDTLAAGRGLCNGPLARLLCEDGPDWIRAMDDWGVGWARKNGCIVQAM